MNEAQAYNRFKHETMLEFENSFLNWDDTMREWHKWALYALKYASPKSTGWPSEKWGQLYEEDTVKGLNLNVVSALCNNLVAHSEYQLEIDHSTYLSVLELNGEMIKRWHEKANPIQLAVNKRLQIMQATDRNVSRGIKMMPKA